MKRLKFTKFEDRLEEVERAVNLLSELFDTVQIFVTSTEDGDTCAHEDGNGNQYARIGQVREWLQEKDIQSARQAVRNDSDDE